MGFYSRLNVTNSGAVDLGGSTLDITIPPATYTPVLGHAFTIISNDGADTYAAPRFANAPNSGSIFSDAGATWSINYAGGDGNDVVITVVATVPTAAGVTVSGRIMTAEGRGVTNAVVTLIDQDGKSRQVATGRRGAYSFEEVEAGRTYVISVRSKRFTFTPRVVTVNDNLTDVDFTAEQGSAARE